MIPFLLDPTEWLSYDCRSSRGLIEAFSSTELVTRQICRMIEIQRLFVTLKHRLGIGSHWWGLEFARLQGPRCNLQSPSQHLTVAKYSRPSTMDL